MDILLRMENNSAQKITSIRKRQKLSQSKLALLADVSQASISRIEKEEQQPELKLFAKIAKALNVELSEIVPEELLNELLGQTYQEQFYAFCPNPFCDKNGTGLNKSTGKPFVLWNSGTSHHIDRYDESNFCSRCGTDLVKECPSCKRKLEDKGSRFCISCGSKISDRPTEDEWKKIEELEKIKEEDFNDDIPF